MKNIIKSNNCSLKMIVHLITCNLMDLSMKGCEKVKRKLTSFRITLKSSNHALPFTKGRRTPFTLYDQTKTGIDKRKRQHKIGIYFTDVCYDLDI